MLTIFSLDIVYVTLQLRKRFIRQCTSLNQNHQRCVSTLSEVVVVKDFSPSVSINSKNLSYPTDLSVWQRADSKLNDFVCLIVDFDTLFTFLGILTISLIHYSRVAELLEVHRLSGYILSELSELLFPLHGKSLMEILNIHIRLQRICHINRRGIDDELKLNHLSIHAADYLAIGNTIGFFVTNNILKDLLGHHIHIEK